MNPANQNQARAQVRHLLLTPRVIKSGRYQNNRSRHRMIKRAETIAEVIWRKYHVGIYRWKSNHVGWYFETQLGDMMPRSRYDHELACRRILVALKKPGIIHTCFGQER